LLRKNPGRIGERSNAFGRASSRAKAGEMNEARAFLFRIGFVFVPALLSACGCTGPHLAPAPQEALAGLTPEVFASHVAFLADPVAGGRMTATPGDDRAAAYVVSQFEAAGLKPGGPDGTWFQSFPLGHILVPGPGCSLEIGGAAAQLGKDYLPIARGGDGALDGPLFFVGYGANDRARGYNDYASVPVRGSVVMVLQGEPHDANGQSSWAAAGKWTDHASTEHKLREAMTQGASAVLLVTPPDISPANDPLEDVLEYERIGIPAMRISRELADRLLRSSPQKHSLAEVVGQMRASGAPDSFALDCRVKGSLRLVGTSGRNVIGVLPADGGPGLATVVICAHRDHLPATGQLAWDQGFGVRPGADDNASGTAALMMLAGAMRQIPDRKCTYIFLSTTGEEIGFQGSTYYVDHPTVALKSIALMVNIDQIGFVRHNQILLLGQPDSPPLAKAIAAVRQWHNPGLDIVRIPIIGNPRWSDQVPFVRKGIEFLFFFANVNGDHKEHHAQGDTPDRLNNDGAAKTVRLAMEILRNLDGLVPQP
jgi:hypothetical protein